MTYHGGRLMTAPAHVYLLWYGTWSSKPAVPVLTDLVRGYTTERAETGALLAAEFLLLVSSLLRSSYS